MDIIDDRYLKARKAHECNWCRSTILPGFRYHDQFLKADGDVYHWKSCARCNFIFTQLVEYMDNWDGIYTEDDFNYGCNAFCQDFLCKSCENYNKEYSCCELDNSPCWDCLDKIGTFLLDNELIEERKDPDKPHSYITNPVIFKVRKRSIPYTHYPDGT